MSIVNNIELIVGWAEKEICSRVKLKLPDDDRAGHTGADDGNYEYKLVSPSAFALFVPTKDRLPPKAAAPIPSICVQIVEGKDLPQSGTTKIRLGFAVWNPGLHRPAHDHPKYERSGDGWRDAWNFVDVAIREISSTEVIGDMLRVVKEDGIAYGPFTEQDAISDYYPYWFAWVEFSVAYGINRNNPAIQQFL